MGRSFCSVGSDIHDLFYLLGYLAMSLGCIMLLVLMFWSHRRLNIFK
ncbi:hypothetical protein J7M28_02825 [bacterium]|nr:hypothetical protein [bacterium]